MAAHTVDLTLARDLKRFGAFDTDACFNCGNCTAVCQHSNETASFPRRLIRYGQLGMRDRLMAAKEAWLCWNCRDCSDTCPRQARPGEYLESVRRYTIASLDPTGISRADVHLGTVPGRLCPVPGGSLLWRTAEPGGEPLRDRPGHVRVHSLRADPRPGHRCDGVHGSRGGDHHCQAGGAPVPVLWAGW